VVAAVPRVAQCDFVDAALRAKANCPVSRALNANISMRAKLSDHDALPRIELRRNAGTLGPGKIRKDGRRRNGARD
jgi:hypothetical protein